jgi:hypothetical protein
MKKFVDDIFNWWVNRPVNIPTNTGTTISMEIFNWYDITWTMVLLYTLLPVILSILICYIITDRSGNDFRNRWWMFMILTSVTVGLLIYIFLSGILIYGPDGVVAFPKTIAVNRAIVGVLQAMVLYYLLSGLISNLLGRIFSINKFKINLRTPIPKLF